MFLDGKSDLVSRSIVQNGCGCISDSRLLVDILYIPRNNVYFKFKCHHICARYMLRALSEYRQR
jgi:hypothetical protein